MAIKNELFVDELPFVRLVIGGCPHVLFPDDALKSAGAALPTIFAAGPGCWEANERNCGEH